MPLYEYRCPAGHLTSAVAPLAKASQPQTCGAPTSGPWIADAPPACMLLAERIMSAPSGFPGADSWRR